jgi:hypothetical protein
MVAAVERQVPHPCNATTARALEALGVGPESVAAVQYSRRTSGSENAHLLGYDAWITLEGAQSVVVRLEPSCAFATAYRRGGSGAALGFAASSAGR